MGKKKSKVNYKYHHQNKQKQPRQEQHQSNIKSLKEESNLHSPEIAEKETIGETEIVEVKEQNTEELNAQSGVTDLPEVKEKNKWTQKFKGFMGLGESNLSDTKLSGDEVQVDSAYLQVLDTHLDGIKKYLIKTSNKITRLEEGHISSQTEQINELKAVMKESNEYIDKLRSQVKGFDEQNVSAFRDLSSSMRNNFEQLKYALARMERLGDIIGEVKKGNGQLVSLKQDITDMAKIINILPSAVSEHLSKELRSFKNRLEALPDTLDDELNLTKRLKGIEKTTDTIQGTLQTLQNQDQSEIKDLLRDKMVNFKKEFPAMNEDEETIVELAKYSEFITEQLSLAARHYARNRQLIEGIHKERNYFGQQLKDAKAQAHQTGFEEGKTVVIKQLLANYTDVDALFESTNEESRILVTYLKNQGLLKDETLLKGSVIVITDENRQLMEMKASFEGLGQYKVMKPAYKLNEAIYQKAVLVLYVNPENDQLQLSNQDLEQEIVQPNKIDDIEGAKDTRSQTSLHFINNTEFVETNSDNGKVAEESVEVENENEPLDVSTQENDSESEEVKSLS